MDRVNQKSKVSGSENNHTITIYVHVYVILVKESKRTENHLERE